LKSTPFEEDSGRDVIIFSLSGNGDDDVGVSLAK